LWDRKRDGGFPGMFLFFSFSSFLSIILYSLLCIRYRLRRRLV
jgi:hypothetical protein